MRGQRPAQAGLGFRVVRGQDPARERLGLFGKRGRGNAIEEAREEVVDLPGMPLVVGEEGRAIGVAQPPPKPAEFARLARDVPYRQFVAQLQSVFDSPEKYIGTGQCAAFFRRE